MFVEKFKALKDERVAKLILEKFPFLSYADVRKIIRQKDVKLNGVRIDDDLKASVGDEILFYYDKDKKLDIVFEDENIVIVNKPRKLETVSATNSDCVLSRLSEQLQCVCFAVHRLDMNTTGLVVFAKNEQSKNSLDRAIHDRKIQKFYLTVLCGTVSASGDEIAYLKKDEKNSLVKISDFPQNGYEKIETRFKLVKKLENFSIVEVELVTGKTHQIRAHFAHLGHPVLGDEKYGISEINKSKKFKFQCLCSYKIKFHFEKDDYLSYLDGKIVELDSEKIDFLSKL